MRANWIFSFELPESECKFAIQAQRECNWPRMIPFGWQSRAIDNKARAAKWFGSIPRAVCRCGRISMATWALKVVLVGAEWAAKVDDVERRWCLRQSGALRISMSRKLITIIASHEKQIGRAPMAIEWTLVGLCLKLARMFQPKSISSHLISSILRAFALVLACSLHLLGKPVEIWQQLSLSLYRLTGFGQQNFEPRWSMEMIQRKHELSNKSCCLLSLALLSVPAKTLAGDLKPTQIALYPSSTLFLPDSPFSLHSFGP